MDPHFYAVADGNLNSSGVCKTGSTASARNVVAKLDRIDRKSLIMIVAPLVTGIFVAPFFFPMPQNDAFGFQAIG